jgi:transposase InsO family protein
VRFSFIHAEKAKHSVVALCRSLGVSLSGYHAWASREPSRRDREDEVLSTHIRAIHNASRGTYGSPRLHAQLHRDGFNPSRKRVVRLMKRDGIRGLTPKRWRSTTDSNHELAVSPNRLERDFTADGPNQVWASDITYIRTWEGWLYLAVIIDLHSRRVVGWAAADHMRAELVVEALQRAVRRRQPPRGVVFHSDRGSQYASGELQHQLALHGFVSSMSRRGDCYDNAVVESFFGSLKSELIDRRPWPTRRQVIDAIDDYIEVFYDTQRLHSTLGYRTPAEVERYHHRAAQAA